MNRLTERLPNGVVRAPVTDENRGDSCMMRLAAYEDTGLTPEEIKTMQFGQAYSKASAIADHYTNIGLPMERIDELAAADKDGRVVVLPCKVGENVWVIYEGKIHETRVQGISVSVSGNDTILHFGGYPAFSAWGSSVGKVVFLSPEAACAALKGGAK